MSEIDHTRNPHLEPSSMRVGKTHNGLGIIITLNNRVHDPQTELLRAFIYEHGLECDLVLVPTGGYSNCPGGASLSFFEIRKSQPQIFARRKWWKRFLESLLTGKVQP